MPIERERKFLVKYFPNIAYEYKKEISQGYLMVNSNQQLRVRIVNKEKAYIAYKKDISLGERYEFEYEIPIDDAVVLLDQCPYKLHKTRYIFKDKNLLIEIDVYPDSLFVAEIEFPDHLSLENFMSDSNNLPNYIGEDITGFFEYANIFLAKKYSSYDSI